MLICIEGMEMSNSVLASFIDVREYDVKERTLCLFFLTHQIAKSFLSIRLHFFNTRIAVFSASDAYLCSVDRFVLFLSISQFFFVYRL